LIRLRKHKQYEKTLELASGFIDYVISGNYPKSHVFSNCIRTAASFVFKESGIVLMKQKRYKEASKFLLAAGVYWLPFCGPKDKHFREFLADCMNSAGMDHISVPNWSAKGADDKLAICKRKPKEIDRILEQPWSAISHLKSIIPS
jgi:hypothetical protein